MVSLNFSVDGHEFVEMLLPATATATAAGRAHPSNVTLTRPHALLLVPPDMKGQTVAARPLSCSLVTAAPRGSGMKGQGRKTQ